MTLFVYLFWHLVFLTNLFQKCDVTWLFQESEGISLSLCAPSILPLHGSIILTVYRQQEMKFVESLEWGGRCVGEEMVVSLPLHWDKDGQHHTSLICKMHLLYLTLYSFDKDLAWFLISRHSHSAPPPHLVTYHFNVGLLTSGLEKIPVLKFTKFRERIYVEYLAVSRKNWELDSAHCPPLLHHLFLPHNARMNRGTKQWLSCGSLYIWCSHCFLRLKDMCRLKAFSVPFSSNSQ